MIIFTLVNKKKRLYLEKCNLFHFWQKSCYILLGGACVEIIISEKALKYLKKNDAKSVIIYTIKNETSAG
ncbi:MAG: hypothetical protein ACI8WT_002275 [Clostridium sp.]|jgi:hypothetical protein